MGLLNKIMVTVFGNNENTVTPPTSRGSMYYIYPKNKEGKRTGQTLCVLLHDGRIFHGLSTCSKEDQFCRSTGRKIALIRAQGAVSRYEARKRG